MATNRNRTAGHNWERTCVNMIRHLFPDCVTSRVESKAQDDKGVDLCNTGKFNIQCKNMSTSLKYEDVLAKMPVEDDKINVIFHKKTKKVNTTFREIGQYAILDLDDFVDLIENTRDDTKLNDANLKIDKLKRLIKKLNSINQQQEEDLLLFGAMKELGVDNWSGYGEANELVEQWKKEENGE